MSGRCPIARMIASAAISNALPSTGRGLLRPSASGSPSSLRTQASAATRPSRRTTAVGEASSTSALPSTNRSSNSSASAGITARVRR